MELEQDLPSGCNLLLLFFFTFKDLLPKFPKVLLSKGLCYFLLILSRDRESRSGGSSGPTSSGGSP